MTAFRWVVAYDPAMYLALPNLLAVYQWPPYPACLRHIQDHFDCKPVVLFGSGCTGLGVRLRIASVPNFGMSPE